MKFIEFIITCLYKNIAEKKLKKFLFSLEHEGGQK